MRLIGEYKKKISFSFFFFWLKEKGIRAWGEGINNGT